MKNRLLSGIILAGLLGCAGQPVRTDLVPSAGQWFAWEIRQKGQVVPVQDGKIVLERAPFQLVMAYKEPMGVLVNAWTNRQLYLDFRDGKSLEECLQGEPGQFMGMAESDRNPEKELILRQGAAMYLYYDNARENRFDMSWQSPQGTVSGIRTVHKLYLILDDAHLQQEIKESYNVAEFPLRDLYLVFYHGEWKSDYSGRTELQRDQLHIEFR